MSYMEQTKRQFTIEVTTTALCNLNCTYCFEGEKVNSVVMPAFILYYLRHFLNFHARQHVKKNCGAGTSTQFFDNDRVIPCTRFSKSPELLDKIEEFYEMVECNICPVRNYCEKGCLIEQIRNERPIAELCTIYKFIYNEIVS